MFLLRTLFLKNGNAICRLPTITLGQKAEPSSLGLVHAISKRFEHSSMSSKKSGDNLVWIDMEMTGLDPAQHHILEIACLITDGNLNIVAEHPNMIIHQPDDILNSMNDWCMKFHNESGLVAASKKSKFLLRDTESQILEFVEKYAPPGKCPMAGNSVYMDRMFLKQYMPLVENHLHYRIVDVSTIKELCRRWFPQEFSQAPKKEFKHRALDDIKESIAEMKYYRSSLFRNK